MGFRGACRLQKNAPRGLGQGIAPRKRAKHTMLPQALRLDRPEGDAHNASAVKKLSAWVFLLSVGKDSLLLLLLATPYARYSLYALLIINSIKHEGYTWLRHINHAAAGFAPCLSGASSACTRAAILYNKVI